MIRLSRLRSAFALAFALMPALALVAAPAGAAPVAIVTDVAPAPGASTQASAIDVRGAPLKLLASLEPGSEIAVATGARVVVFYVTDGSEWTLDGGRYRLARNAPQPVGAAAAPRRSSVPPALAKVAVANVRAVQGGLQMRGGESAPPALVSPVDEVVLDRDVTLAWTPAAAGTTYRVDVVDVRGARVFAGETTATSLPLDATAALAAGEAYAWSVSGRDPDGAAPFYRAARFRVADEATRARLEAARPAPDAPFATRALYVALLERAGARSAARAARAALEGERSVAWAPLD